MYSMPHRAAFPLISLYALFLIVVGLWPFDFQAGCSDCVNGASITPEAPGISFASEGMVMDAEAGVLLHERLQGAAGLTIAVHVRSDTLFQQGPARIISLSNGPAERNFTLGQQRDAAVLRLRTPVTGQNGSDPQTSAPGVIWPGEDVFLVATYDGAAFRIYADGVLAGERALAAGDFAGWAPDHVLIYGNETTGDRPWRGQLYDAAIFDRALTRDEIEGLTPEGLAKDNPGKVIHLASRCPSGTVTAEARQVGACDLPPEYRNAHKWDVLWSGMRAPTDYLSNFVLWLPVGVLFALLMAKAGPSRIGLVAVTLILLAALIEIGQAQLFSRTSALHDLFAALTGLSAGVIAWRWWHRRHGHA